MVSRQAQDMLTPKFGPISLLVTNPELGAEDPSTALKAPALTERLELCLRESSHSDLQKVFLGAVLCMGEGTLLQHTTQSLWQLPFSSIENVAINILD